MYNGIISLNELNCIGKNGKLPWKIPEELEFFKQTTLNNIVVMGRKTCESIKGPLRNRVNVILTKNMEYKLPCTFTKQDHTLCILYKGLTLSQILFELDNITLEYTPTKQIFVIGGEQIYKMFDSVIDRWYISRVNSYEMGDIYWNNFDTFNFREQFFISRCLIKNYKFITYQFDRNTF